MMLSTSLLRLAAFATLVGTAICGSNSTDFDENTPDVVVSDPTAYEMLHKLLSPVAVLRYTSERMSSRIVTFAAVWVATLLLLRFSLILFLSGMNILSGYFLKDPNGKLSEPHLDIESVPRIIQMSMKKSLRRRVSAGTKRKRVADESSTTQGKSLSSTISTSSTNSNKWILPPDDLSESSGSSSSSSITDKSLPAFLKWIDEPYSSEESVQSYQDNSFNDDDRSRVSKEAFKCRSQRRKRSIEDIAHLRSDAVDDGNDSPPSNNESSVPSKTPQENRYTFKRTYSNKSQQEKKSAARALRIYKDKREKEANRAATRERTDLRPRHMLDLSDDSSQSQKSSLPDLELGMGRMHKSKSANHVERRKKSAVRV